MDSESELQQNFNTWLDDTISALKYIYTCLSLKL